VNLSLDTLDRERFKEITLRDEFEACLSTLSALQQYQIPVKVNTVVMEGKNIDDIIPIAELSQKGVSVRFIEEMPFNGTGSHYQKLEWNYQRILKHLQSYYPDLEKVQDESNSTSSNLLWHLQPDPAHSTRHIENMSL
jgi:cyclic pyranopterin phosphate synthase